MAQTRRVFCAGSRRRLSSRSCFRCRDSGHRTINSGQSGEKMKQKIVSVLVYSFTALDFAYYFESLYGAGPVTRHLGLIHAAIIGALLFAAAAVFSLFSLRIGIAFAFAACILSWPFFAGELSAILSVWHSIFSVVRYSYWGARLAAVYMLIVSSIYSAGRWRVLYRAPETLPTHELSTRNPLGMTKKNL
jgi:hypothetical protein